MSQKRMIAVAFAAVLLFACTAMMASTNKMGIADKQPIAKANCNLVPLTAKAEHTSQRFAVNASNDHVLQEITFAGDKATHVLAQ
jgi:hypothetical protein